MEHHPAMASDIEAHNALAGQQTFYGGALKRAFEKVTQLEEALGQTRAALAKVSKEAAAEKQALQAEVANMQASEGALLLACDGERAQHKEALKNSVGREKAWLETAGRYNGALSDILRLTTDYHRGSDHNRDQFHGQVEAILAMVKGGNDGSSEGG